MTKHIVIVGGGTAGWMTACYLARMLAGPDAQAVKITLVESEDIGIIGVGEGTFPSIRKTLKRIGLDEAALVREANATFKQGIRFANWRHAPSVDPSDHYYHPFQIAEQHTDLDLLPYWLLGEAGEAPWARASTVQQAVIEARRAPKLIDHPDYAGPLSYAYHFDAVAFGQVLRRHAIGQGVVRIADTIGEVRLAQDGAIAALVGAASGELRADLYIDCTGFRAQLIGQALKSEFTSYRDQLFCDRALAVQLPYEQPDAPIASCTISTAQENGWTWDIGLQERRGVGYVYSSQHTDDERAAQVLSAYAGLAPDRLEPRLLKFEAGFRKTQWRKNCVAIGLSAGFIEPLEATGIGFSEIAALILANLFPWSGEYEQAARQFNAQMQRRYAHVIDFIKLHYCLSQREDTAFWRDNRAASSISETLKEKLQIWRHRPPSFLDVDLNHDIFVEQNWQYILYGMGFATDLTGRAPALRFSAAAREEFASIAEQARFALTVMPDHRALIDEVRRSGFQRPAPARRASR
ncbi:tryptophan halogenase family protein [Caulobacter sp. BK020]|uniref:tryptophan halogenase family protein n=1 Tax=Caulobacter sp. BK020 TaxID=2512117 RepID=UPI00104A31E7|nr:tryptophan halogenase family protein [Caulobacter sp. BK020]TCS10268.1 glycine/D-amino acid oxidase-like deaminating enzyme [Caulobacter sp. BK020]